ncbi:hypothetical protein Nepgr_018321 [Nepenthes gracilis]|uniref:AP2/ERF domain-containing protein n=1 Tax=Nepenthes gracilis TaxID=150966 RepID=A0AAD3ST41_NEPGR|nr:hypothetical protein Nepgr_018321 [Nepenthes gracilis]
MKSMNDEKSGSNNNWLGFSSSPDMKMEGTSDLNHHQYHLTHHQTQTPSVPAAASSSVCPQQFNTYGVCFGAGENGGFHPPLTVMPLKSDGSLCITEALRSPQPEEMVPNSSPKLEIFLGGSAMGSHQYGSHERETMAFSLDSIYYHQTADQERYSYYSAEACHGLYQAPLEAETKDTQIVECDAQATEMAEDDTRCLKSWVAGSYSAHHALEQQMNICSMENNGGGSAISVADISCRDLQSLRLSMSPGSQSSCVTAPPQTPPSRSDSMTMETKKRGLGKVIQKQPVHRKSIETFGHRTSQYRGVTKHRWTGRYEAHLWDNSCKKEGQTRKGRQGGYDMEEKAARAYDLAALKYWGSSSHINLPLENYKEELEEMKSMTRQEYVSHLRRRSSGFSRGASMYRGVTRYRIADTQEDAAEAYDIAAIKFRGVNAVTNFDISRYDVEKIMSSDTLLPGDQAKRIHQLDPSTEAIGNNPPARNSGNCSGWKTALFTAPQLQPNDTGFEQLDPKPMSIGNYHSPLSVCPHDVICIRPENSSHPMVVGDQSTKVGSIHFSNLSSLATSLSSSREASPGKSGSSASIFFSKPPPLSWTPSAPTTISMAHLPMFAAWSDP